MSFIDQVERIFGLNARHRFQVSVFGDECFYIEGARPLKLDGDEFIFRVDKKLITLAGEGLCVKELTDDCVAVVGKIRKFEVQG